MTLMPPLISTRTSPTPDPACGEAAATGPAATVPASAAALARRTPRAASRIRTRSRFVAMKPDRLGKYSSGPRSPTRSGLRPNGPPVARS